MNKRIEIGRVGVYVSVRRTRHFETAMDFSLMTDCVSAGLSLGFFGANFAAAILDNGED